MGKHSDIYFLHLTILRKSDIFQALEAGECFFVKLVKRSSCDADHIRLCRNNEIFFCSAVCF